MKKKRAKRGEVSHELLYLIFEYLIAFAIIGALFKFVHSVAENTLYEKVYLSRDTALTLNSVYVFDGKLEYAYDPGEVDISKFSFDFRNSKAEIKEAGVNNDVSVYYPYGANTDVIMPRTGATNPKQIRFEKTNDQLQLLTQ